MTSDTLVSVIFFCAVFFIPFLAFVIGSYEAPDSISDVRSRTLNGLTIFSCASIGSGLGKFGLAFEKWDWNWLYYAVALGVVGFSFNWIMFRREEKRVLL